MNWRLEWTVQLPVGRPDKLWSTQRRKRLGKAPADLQTWRQQSMSTELADGHLKTILIRRLEQ
jgi:hypothetical protein